MSDNSKTADCELQKLSISNKDEFETKTINVLIVGQTGAGKSTNINAIANYLKFETLAEAAVSLSLYILVQQIKMAIWKRYSLYMLQAMCEIRQCAHCLGNVRNSHIA